MKVLCQSWCKSSINMLLETSESTCAIFSLSCLCVILCNSVSPCAVCLFCRVSVPTFHLSRPLMAAVRACALIRVLWTCRLIAEEAEQVITSESLIAQTRRKKNTGQGGSHGWRSQPSVAGCSWVPSVSHWAAVEHLDQVETASLLVCKDFSEIHIHTLVYVVEWLRPSIRNEMGVEGFFSFCFSKIGIKSTPVVLQNPVGGSVRSSICPSLWGFSFWELQY